MKGRAELCIELKQKIKIHQKSVFIVQTKKKNPHKLVNTFQEHHSVHMLHREDILSSLSRFLQGDRCITRQNAV